MNVFFLGEDSPLIIDTLNEFGCQVIRKNCQIKPDDFIDNNIEFAVSYRYRHIIKKQIIKCLKNRIINLHISLLPWNKGADPNLWSFLEDTPKGVTIHYIDEGLDTGEIIVQQEIDYDSSDTLRSTYNRLSATIEDLFKLHCSDIISGKLKSFPQTGVGSCHRLKDKEPFLHLLTDGWDTPVMKIIGKGIIQ